ncbi:hypothetical protein [Cellvibrio sp. OA-2007]|uniref:hypothetical protein n=1 Tax=Cellvibrio sp. OA-2007 TaxID=529823 RepID=UPI0007827328|nr:hypothetical protein [Cellvibrio sp. OA-2007]
MRSKKDSLDIEHISSVMGKELKDTSPETLKLFDFAIQSIQKRISYCKYHLSEFNTHSTPVALLKDRLDPQTDDELSIRILYEANAFGFISNLHALVDSLPFILNIIFNTREIDNTGIGWNPRFINGYRDFTFFSQLENFQKNNLFVKLKGLTNTSKHKYLTRLKNDFKKISFESISYREKKEEKLIADVDAEQFMIDSYNTLIPELIWTINLIIEAKKNSRTETLR